MSNAARATFLVVVALVSAALWRLEVEWHGWDGLLWISYFHLAIPIGILLFAGWLAVCSTIEPKRRRISFSITFVAYAALTYHFTHSAVVAFYSGYFIVLPGTTLLYWLRHYSIFLIAPLIPVGYLILARLFGARITFRQTLITLTLFTCAFPVAIGLLEITNHRGRSDVLHAIKSGYVIPFLVISLGSVFVFNQWPTPNENEPPKPNEPT